MHRVDASPRLGEPRRSVDGGGYISHLSSRRSSSASYQENDVRTMLERVLHGIDSLSAQQARMEMLLRNCPPAESPVGRGKGSDAMAGAMTRRNSVGMMRIESLVIPNPASHDDEETLHSNDNTWPASIPARHHDPEEDAQEDDKLVSAIAKIGLGTLGGMSSHRGGTLGSGASGQQWRLPVLHPSSTKMLCLDIIGTLFLLHDICITPCVIAWHLSVQGWLLAFQFASFFFWTFDTAIVFCTAYYKNGELHQSQPGIFYHVLRTKFTFNLILLLAEATNLWIDTAGMAYVNEGSSVRAIRTLKLTRMLKVSRVNHTFRLLDKLYLHEGQSFRSSGTWIASLVARIVFFMLVANHIVACLWFWQGKYGLTDNGWTWLQETNLMSASFVLQYVTSLHWSVAQMTLGGTDTSPVNSYERIIGIISLVNGMVFGCTTVSYVSAAIVDYIMIQRDATNQMVECRRFLLQYQCPQTVGAQVIKQVAKRLSEEVPLQENQVSALRLLAPTLQTQLRLATRRPHVQRHALINIWSQIEPRCIDALCHSAVSHSFLSHEDDLFNPGQSCNQAWFVVRGRLRYVQNPNSSKVVRTEITPVHQGTWISEVALWSLWAHVGTCEASGPASHLLSISSQALIEVLEEFPTVERLAQQYAKNYHAYLTSASPPHSQWPNDLHVPNTEDVAMLLSQHVGLGLLKRGLASGSLVLSDEDEAYVTKELMAGKCTIQYSDDGTQLERVVGLTNVMLRYEPDSFTNPSPKPLVLYQVGAVTQQGKTKLSLHIPGTKRWTGESPQAALKRILEADLRVFAPMMEVENSERKVSVKDSTQSLKMRTKTVKTIYRSNLQELPKDIMSMQVPFPELPGLVGKSSTPDSSETDSEPHQFQLLVLPQEKEAGLYAFLLPAQYEIMDNDDNKDAMKAWMSTVKVDLEELAKPPSVKPHPEAELESVIETVLSAHLVELDAQMLLEPTSEIRSDNNDVMPRSTAVSELALWQSAGSASSSNCIVGDDNVEIWKPCECEHVVHL